LHSSQCYSVSGAYNKLSEVDINQHHNSHKFVWLKVVPLKRSIFVWRLLHNRVPTRDNLLQQRIIARSDQEGTTTCGMNEDVNHLFVNCNFHGRLWYLVSGGLGFSTVYNSRILEHIYQFCSLGGFSHKAQCSHMLFGYQMLGLFGMSVTSAFFKGRKRICKSFVKG
jgi:hypothetical protein